MTTAGTQYNDSTPPENPEQKRTRRMLAATIKRLKRQFDWALRTENGELAESYHNRIVALEFLARELSE